jgi:hypothetical protein
MVSCHTADSKPVKQEVNRTMILPPFSIPWTKDGVTSSSDPSLVMSKLKEEFPTETTPVSRVCPGTR